jgi:undecaprenyl-diphosphatase
MAASANDPARLTLIFLVVTLSSVLGSLVAWWMGERWGKPLLDRFAKPSTVRRFDTLVTRYGAFGVFIAALSPIPYKVLGWCAGIGGMDRRQFIAAGLVGRSLRFGAEVLLVGFYGDLLLEFLKGPGFMVVSLTGALLAWPAWRWWKGLDEMPDEEE